jgi:hypothetical protein
MPKSKFDEILNEKQATIEKLKKEQLNYQENILRET